MSLLGKNILELIYINRTELSELKPEDGWVGLSEIIAHGDHVYVVERDNQHDDRAGTRMVYRIPLS